MRRLLALLLCLALLSAPAACADAQAQRGTPGEDSPGGGNVRAADKRGEVASPAPAAEPTRVRVYVDGLLRLRGDQAEGRLWLCPAELCRLFELDAAESFEGGRYTLSVGVWRFEAEEASEVFSADGRLLYCPEGLRLFDGRVCFPSDTVGRLFSLTFRFDGEKAETDSGSFRLLLGGEDYYQTHFSPDDLYWLEHIIQSEARWEPLAGKIGVGSVVLNRVRDAHFPDTVTGVVLERTPVVQFSPIETGEAAAEPEEEAKLAARLCLEGFNTVGESLYFVNPERGDGSWFADALTPTVTIGLHHFYK